MCSLASCAADFLSSSSSNTLKPSTSIASLSSPSEPSFFNGRAAFLCDSRRSGALSIPVRASPRFGSLGSSFGLPDRAFHVWPFCTPPRTCLGVFRFFIISVLGETCRDLPTSLQWYYWGTCSSHVDFRSRRY